MDKDTPPTEFPGLKDDSVSDAAAPAPVSVSPPASSPTPVEQKRGLAAFVEERPPTPIYIPERKLKAITRRDFLLYGAGVVAAAAGFWWLLPEEVQQREFSPAHRAWLDTLEARAGLSSTRAAARKENVLGRALTFDDDVAEVLYSKDRRIPTYTKAQVTPNLRNNYDGPTPEPDYLDTWKLTVAGLASGRVEKLTLAQVVDRMALHEEITRLVCVEGWSAIAWWGGVRFADFLRVFPPAPGMKWASLYSSVNLATDDDGNSIPDPYYVSIDLDTARHPQTLLATHQNGVPLGVEHGAPMRLIVPMKLGLKNIKAITKISYTTHEPADYWRERGYSKYDGL